MVSRLKILVPQGAGRAELSVALKQHWKELREYQFSSVVLLPQEDTGRTWCYQILSAWAIGNGEKVSLLPHLDINSSAEDKDDTTSSKEPGRS